MRHRPYHRPRGRLLFALLAVLSLAGLLFVAGSASATSGYTSTPDSGHTLCAGWVNTHAFDMTDPSGAPQTDWYSFSTTPVQGPLQGERCYADSASLASYITGHGSNNPIVTVFTNSLYSGYSLEVLTFFPKQCTHPDTGPQGYGPDFSIYGPDTLWGTGFNDNISSYYFSSSESANCTTITVEDNRPAYANPPGSNNDGTVTAFPPYYNWSGKCNGTSVLDCASGESHTRWVDSDQTNLAGSGWNDTISAFQIFNKDNFCPFPGANSSCGNN